MKIVAGILLTLSCLSAQQPASRLDSLHEFSTSLENLAQRVNHAVVQIFSSGYALSEDTSVGAATVRRQRASGTGVILSADGYIVTNAHVVANARRLRVRVPADSQHGNSVIQPEPKLLEARVLGVDRDTDLALIKIERSGLPHLDLDDSESLRARPARNGFRQPPRHGEFRQHGCH